MDQGSMDPLSGPGPWIWSIVLPIQKVSQTFVKANLIGLIRPKQKFLIRPKQ